jgi:hypothetical protein
MITDLSTQTALNFGKNTIHSFIEYGFIRVTYTQLEDILTGKVLKKNLTKNLNSKLTKFRIGSYIYTENQTWWNNSELLLPTIPSCS